MGNHRGLTIQSGVQTQIADADQIIVGAGITTSAGALTVSAAGTSSVKVSVNGAVRVEVDDNGALKVGTAFALDTLGPIIHTTVRDAGSAGLLVENMAGDTWVPMMLAHNVASSTRLDLEAGNNTKVRDISFSSERAFRVDAGGVDDALKVAKTDTGAYPLLMLAAGLRLSVREALGGGFILDEDKTIVLCKNGPGSTVEMQLPEALDVGASGSDTISTPAGTASSYSLTANGQAVVFVSDETLVWYLVATNT
jgi:hypothetical protein